jgi:hypothetical protein
VDIITSRSAEQTLSSGLRRVVLDVAPDIKSEIRVARWKALTGTGEGATGHGSLIRLKVAALCALIEGRLDIQTGDWQLGGSLVDHSDRVARWVKTEITRAETEAHDRDTALIARRAGTLQASRVAKEGTIERVAAVICRAVNVNGPMSIGVAKSRIASRDRCWADAAVACAIKKGWVLTHGEQLYPKPSD